MTSFLAVKLQVSSRLQIPVDSIITLSTLVFSKEYHKNKPLKFALSPYAYLLLQDLYKSLLKSEIIQYTNYALLVATLLYRFWLQYLVLCVLFRRHFNKVRIINVNY